MPFSMRTRCYEKTITNRNTNWWIKEYSARAKYKVSLWNLVKEKVKGTIWGLWPTVLLLSNVFRRGLLFFCIVHMQKSEHLGNIQSPAASSTLFHWSTISKMQRSVGCKHCTLSNVSPQKSFLPLLYEEGKCTWCVSRASRIHTMLFCK